MLPDLAWLGFITLAIISILTFLIFSTFITPLPGFGNGKFFRYERNEPPGYVSLSRLPCALIY